MNARLNTPSHLISVAIEARAAGPVWPQSHLTDLTSSLRLFNLDCLHSYRNPGYWHPAVQPNTFIQHRLSMNPDRIRRAGA